MQFHLHSLGPERSDPQCYFRLEDGPQSVYSPLLRDRTAAFRAMEQLIRRLRKGEDGGKIVLHPVGDAYALRLFGQQLPAVGTGPSFADREAARQLLDDWKITARGRTYKVTLWRPEALAPEITTLEDLDLSTTDRDYAWREEGSTILHLEENSRLKFIPTVGLQPGLIGSPCTPIFHAMEPFVAADLPLFFGREEEVEDVYALLQRHRLLLFYGTPRVGKTSLIQCGLANRLAKDTEALRTVKLKRGDDFTTTLATALNAACAPTDPPRRTYLVIDQLERLFAPDVLDEDRRVFFDLLRDTLAADHPELRIVLILREAFLAPLVDYAERCPGLLDNRYRLLSLRESSMIDATVDVLDVLTIQERLAVDDAQAVSERICRELANDRGEVPAHCLQIYLHQLHQKSCQNTSAGPVPLTTEVVEGAGSAPNLIDAFIGERLAGLIARRPPEPEAPDPDLEAEIAELEASRVSCGCQDRRPVAAAAAVVAAPPPPAVVPWPLWLLLAALPFGLFFLYGYANPAGGEALTPCQLAERTATCEAYLNYLCTYGEEGECTAEFRTTLEARGCEVWEDYSRLERYAECATYQAFFEKYRDRDVCLDFVRARLLDWSCPLVRDTVRLVVRDTVVRTVPGPSGYNRPPAAPVPADGPPCKQIDGTDFKRVGPLWIMTEAVAGGPYRWEDALDACTARGWRLPCIGEVEFLIEKIYRDDPGRAFEMLSGSGPCYLVNPAAAAGGKIEFWTATEADDATAWSYLFDVTNRTIRSQPTTPKSARLPCLCVERDPERQGSGLPPCFQKNVNRRSSR